MAATAADPRALLKAARKERRITHPHASYTSNGGLLCNLCSVSIKSDAAWGAHLHSTGHTLRLSRDQDAKAVRSTEQQLPTPSDGISNGNGNGKKRKASVPEEDALEERKKLKGLENMAKGVDPTSQPAHLEKSPSTWSGATAGQRPNAKIPVDLISDAHESSSRQAPKDESAELAELEADLAALEREVRATANPQAHPTFAHPAALKNGMANSNAIISAPAMTAEQLAAQDREEKSAQRGRRDVELEDEKEEAAVRLEAEFEEMKGYEDRVKRLRERREMVRTGQDAASAPVVGNGDIPVGPPSSDVVSMIGGQAEDEQDDDDEEDYDDWGFGRR